MFVHFSVVLERLSNKIRINPGSLYISSCSLWLLALSCRLFHLRLSGSSFNSYSSWLIIHPVFDMPETLGHFRRNMSLISGWFSHVCMSEGNDLTRDIEFVGIFSLLSAYSSGKRENCFFFFFSNTNLNRKIDINKRRNFTLKQIREELSHRKANICRFRISFLYAILFRFGLTWAADLSVFHCTKNTFELWP